MTAAPFERPPSRAVSGRPASPRISRLRLRVRSLDAAARFYGEVLGLDRLPAPAGTGATAVFGRGANRALLHLGEASAAPARPEHSAGLHHFALDYGDRRQLAHALRRLAEHCWPLQGGTDHGIAESIYLADPDGNGIELYWENFGPAARAGRRPLDLHALLELAAPAPFAERPPATLAIGHVHMQAASLATAERFYHECLGFAVRGRVPGAVFFTASHEHHQIAANVWSGHGDAPRECLGLAAWRIQLPDPASLEALRGRARALGYPILPAPTGNPEHLLRLADPHGAVVEIEAAM